MFCSSKNTGTCINKCGYYTQKTTRQWQTQDLENFGSKMVVLSIVNEI